MRPNWAKKLWHRSTALRILPTPACFWPRLGARNRNPAAWARLAERYQRLQGINWDQVLLDGSKKPSKKGAKRPALRR